MKSKEDDSKKQIKQFMKGQVEHAFSRSAKRIQEA